MNDVGRAAVPQQAGAGEAGRDPLRIQSGEGEINQMGAQQASHMISPGQEHTQEHMRSHHQEELRQQDTTR